MEGTTQIDEETTDAKAAVGEIMRLLVCSDLRKSLILSLQEGPKSLAELRNETGASSTAAIHALRELEREHLTHENDKRQYALTNVGKVIALKFEDLNKTIAVLTTHRDFWLEHDLSDIPEPFLQAFSSLHESYLVTSTVTDVTKVTETFAAFVENSRQVKGLSPVFFPELLTIFARLAAKGVECDLIVTQPVLDKILELSNVDELKTACKKQTLKLHVIKQAPQIAFTVTDYFISIGLFRWDGIYDIANDLLSYDQRALEWGQKLFDYYVSLSEPVNFQTKGKLS
jgi:predicted transcriptional regulator